MTSPYVLWVLVACAGSHHSPVKIEVDGHAITVEVVSTPETRSKGLMDRDSMAEDAGMLFVYPDEQPRSFWMKNTRIPLSIAFADHTGKIVRIADMTPYTTNNTPSLYPAMYALETNVGWFEKNDVVAGELLSNLPKVQAK